MASVRLDFYDLDDDALPDVCMKCGAPAVTRNQKTFSWHPSWALVLLLLGLLPYVIAALILTKRRRVSIPFCETHKNHWLWRVLFALGSLAVPLLLFAAGVAADSAGLAVAGVLSAIVWLIAVAVVFNTAINVVEITDDSIKLRNVGGEFVRAYEEMDRGHSRQYGEGGRGEWDQRDDRIAARPRSDVQRPPYDAFEKR
jgi:hypothetical protein